MIMKSKPFRLVITPIFVIFFLVYSNLYFLTHLFSVFPSNYLFILFQYYSVYLAPLLSLHLFLFSSSRTVHADILIFNTSNFIPKYSYCCNCHNTFFTTVHLVSHLLSRSYFNCFIFLTVQKVS